MRKLAVYYQQILAGVLAEESPESYIFRYDDAYFADATKPSISLTLPKSRQEHRSTHIFPFFSNMTAEGANRALQKSVYQLHDHDVISFLLHTAQHDNIGAITIRPL
jgi:serine/threonine-protein kinase HipA